VRVWGVPVTDRYPEGARFRLVLMDRATGDIVLLYDNRYQFRGVAQLLKDFLEQVARIEEIIR
jgi:hypothetical protein